MNHFSTAAKDSRSLGVYARAAALSWVARWGWAAGIVIDAAGYLGGKSRGLAAALCEAGLLKRNEWTFSTHIKYYYILSRQGLDFLYENLDQANEIADKFDYPRIIIPAKSPRFQTGIAVHNLFVQILGAIYIIDAQTYGRAVFYKTNAECAGMRKIPDFMIERKSGVIDYIEFEYSKKSHAEIQNFLINYYFMLNQPGAESYRAHIHFINSNLQSPFTRFWKPESILSEFQRNEKGQWIREIIPVELPYGDYLSRLNFRSAKWHDLLARLSSLPRLPASVKQTERQTERLW